MHSMDQAVSFMDLLDLDEEIIDKRLKSIMEKDQFSNKNLAGAIQLLQYKQLVNAQDGCDCENEEEWEFATKLVKQISEENIDAVCRIVSIILRLNAETLVNKSEHLLQQILSDIDMPTDIKDGAETPDQSTALWYFKISESVLDAVISQGINLNLPFLELPLKSILHSCDEKLKVHFLTNTVPKFFEGVSGFSILDKVWEHIKGLQDDKRDVFLNILSLLSEYYLPVADDKGSILFESMIIYQHEFWNNVYHGMLSEDTSLRKISIYLAKRALDCVTNLNKSLHVKLNNDTLFRWDHSNKKNEKIVWDNFFILIDSLEEKQSNIVLPSLQLFASLRCLGNWLNCAFNIGLKHDNTQVRLKCIQYRLEMKIKNQSEASVLLEALNDINLYDNAYECEDLKKKLREFIEDRDVFMHVFASIAGIKWSPVPFYHISHILSSNRCNELLRNTNLKIGQIITDILKVPCNNVAIRKAVFVNVATFVGNNYMGLHWQDILSIFCKLQSEVNDNLDNLLKPLVTRNFVNDDEKSSFCEVLFKSHLYIEFVLLYLQNHTEDGHYFKELLTNKLQKLDEIVSRRYSEQSGYVQDSIYLMQLCDKTREGKTFSLFINEMISEKFQIILYYIASLLSSSPILPIDDIKFLSDGLKCVDIAANKSEVFNLSLQLYKASLLLLRDNETSLAVQVLCINLIHSLTMNKTFQSKYKHEMLKLYPILQLTMNIKNKQSDGRLKNIFYEKTCEIVFTMIKDEESEAKKHLNDITEFMGNAIDCGGYGCLRHCLNIINAILPALLENKDIRFDINQFINKMWQEIEELKSNNQYNPCMEEFIYLITNDELLKRSMFNNIVILYCNKIVEYGSVKIAPLFYLVACLYNKVITSDYGQLIYVLGEILLYSPVPRKDQRIVENLVIQILQEPKYGSSTQHSDIHFNFQIQYISVLILTKITDKDILTNIELFMKKRIDDGFKNKQRYHGHSQAHRLLLTALQHLLLISALKPATEVHYTWCVELLGRLPHQPSVRICLEWYIALQLYIKKKIINQELVNTLEKIPMTSQFVILYWIVKHKIKQGVCSNEEYEFVMDLLLSHTMGQMFNIRLYAQYMATKLFGISKIASSKYSYTINVIENTFLESAKDKSFVKLQQDYFVNTFDILSDFTPSFIYYFMPQYCEINSNESVDLNFVKDTLKDITMQVKSNDFFKNLVTKQTSDEEIFSFKTLKDTKSKVIDDVEELGTIQKKYIPWKNMSDVNVYETGKKKRNHNELIVVASLIDKLPNLGGMARTSEVFGVKTYVVDSLRHLQDKQFQGLSVSAERWIDVEEVRPGLPLKQYLLQKKSDGYSVVAAEQTSTSAKLQSFKFPRKTLLLLGHEKEGIPCDLLPMMDYCVEIPQQGFVRSLNVHVTAAIFVWEYARQNIL